MTRKAPPPPLVAATGKPTKLPMPTAEPAAARTNPSLLLKCSRSAFIIFLFIIIVRMRWQRLYQVLPLGGKSEQSGRNKHTSNECKVLQTADVHFGTAIINLRLKCQSIGTLDL